MSGRDDFGREEKAARNAALRNQIDDMLADLRKRTADIQDKQEAAAQRTFEASSDDGMVTVRVDATGTVQEVRLSDKAFERTNPEKLARTVTSVIREASGTAQRNLQSTFSAEADVSTYAPGLSYIQEGGFGFPFGDYLEMEIDDHDTTHMVFGEGFNYDSPGSVWYVRGR